MQLILYRNFSKKSNSTKQPTEAGTVVDVKLKDRTTVENPTFLINGVDLDVNYCKWDNHYYFINDIILSNNNIYELVCTQDLLATYKTEIGAYNCYIERSASSFNTFFNDPIVSARQDITAINTAVTNLTGITGSGGCYILRLAGGGERGISTYATADLSNFGKIFDKDEYIGEGEDPYENLGLIIFDPFKYVISLSWCPLDISLIAAFGSATPWIDIKWYTIFGIAGVYKLNDNAFINSTITLNKPTAAYNDFRAYNAMFSEYSIYLPGIGNQPLSPEHTKGNLVLDYYIDVNTGDTFYKLVSTGIGVGESTIATYTTNIYRQLQIGNDSVNINQLLQGASSITSAGASLASGDIVSGINLASSTISTVQNLFTPMPSLIGSDGGISVKSMPQVKISQTIRGSGGLDVTRHGRPLFEVKQINTLSGFVKCGGASIDLPCLAGDRDRVNSYLNNGFYYE